MKIIILPEAITELNQAVSYYEEQKLGLGLEFAAEVDSSIRRIEEYTEAWSKLSRRTRQCLVKRFPFGVIYYIASDTINIVAIAHLHRKPGYWKKRLH